MLSFLREADKSDGGPGPLSARRIAAFVLIFAALPLFYFALKFSSNGWIVFLPGGMCLAAAIVLFSLPPGPTLRKLSPPPQD
jgi:hypothetical protein